MRFDFVAQPQGDSGTSTDKIAGASGVSGGSAHVIRSANERPNGSGPSIGAGIDRAAAISGRNRTVPDGIASVKSMGSAPANARGTQSAAANFSRTSKAAMNRPRGGGGGSFAITSMIDSAVAVEAADAAVDVAS